MAQVLFIERWGADTAMVGYVDLNSLPQRIGPSHFAKGLAEVTILMDEWTQLHGRGQFGAEEEIAYQSYKRTGITVQD